MVKKIICNLIIIFLLSASVMVYATEIDSNKIGEIEEVPKTEDIEKEEITAPEDGNQNTSDNVSNPPSSDTIVDEDNSSDSVIEEDNQENSSVEKPNINNDVSNSENESNSKNEEENKQNNSIQQPEQQKPQTSTQNNSNILNNNYIQPKSSEARLKELKVDVEGLTPEFDKNITEYYLVVDLSVNKIKVTASTVDNKAKWAIYGDKNLKEGENTITIVVTAEDKTKKEYYIHVTKVNDVELANAELASLTIDEYNLYPSFKSNIYSYNLNINEKLDFLDINATPQNEKATIKIEGNENLQEGENIIKVNVTAENKETVRIYKINAYITLDKVEIQEESKLPAIILIGVLGILIVVLGIYVILKNRK